jgi:hypothetical protein
MSSSGSSAGDDVFALGTRIGLAVSLAAVLAISIAFGRRQSRGAIGGRMSRPKQVWLGYAVYTWFFVCPVIGLFEVSLAPALRWACALFGGFMWIRGIVELVMLYATKTWRPPYGVAHDLASIALILLTLGLGDLEATRALDRWTLAFIASVVVSLGLETYYALAFHRAVRGHTTGDAGIWFADDEDAAFQKINRVTTAGNAVLCAALAAFLAVGFAPP